MKYILYCIGYMGAFSMKLNGLGIVFALFLIQHDIQAQNVADSTITSLFDRTFHDYFANQDSLKEDFYIIEDSLPDNIKVDYQYVKLNLISYSEAYHLIREGKISTLYHTELKHLNTDTIDLIIHINSVSFKRTFRIRKINGKRRISLQEFYFASHCNGTLGYIPQGRITYDPETQIWKYFSEQALITRRKQVQQRE